MKAQTSTVKLVDGRPVMTSVPKEPGLYKVTYAYLQIGGGDTSVYAVCRGKLHVPKGRRKPYVDLGKAQHIAHLEISPAPKEIHPPEIDELTIKLANAEYPAFTWPKS